MSKSETQQSDKELFASLTSLLLGMGMLVDRIESIAPDGKPTTVISLEDVSEPKLIRFLNGESHRPADYIWRAMRATEWGTDLWYITNNRQRAEQLARILKHPWHQTRRGRTYLYNLNETVQTEGGQLLIPERRDMASWTLTSSGMLELLDGDGEFIDSGEVGFAVRNTITNVPLYRRVDGEHIVEGTDGSVVDRYESRSALYREWTPLRQPLIPNWTEYLNHIRIFYLDEEDLTPLPLFASESAQDEWSAAAVSKWLVDYSTIRTPEERIDKHEFYTFLRTQLNDIDAVATPNVSELGKFLHSKFDTVSRDEGTGITRYIDGRQWRFPTVFPLADPAVADKPEILQ